MLRQRRRHLGADSRAAERRLADPVEDARRCGSDFGHERVEVGKQPPVCSEPEPGCDVEPQSAAVPRSRRAGAATRHGPQPIGERDGLSGLPGRKRSLSERYRRRILRRPLVQGVEADQHEVAQQRVHVLDGGRPAEVRGDRLEILQDGAVFLRAAPARAEPYREVRWRGTGRGELGQRHQVARLADGGRWPDGRSNPVHSNAEVRLVERRPAVADDIAAVLVLRGGADGDFALHLQAQARHRPVRRLAVNDNVVERLASVPLLERDADHPALG